MIEKEHLKKAQFSRIKGQESLKQQLKTAILANRHVILIGPPGVGKTTLVRSLSELLQGQGRFIRVQGSPDLTAEDLLGDIDPVKALEHGPLSLEAFTKGKVFKADKGILFFDEINRCNEKLQNALLQVLEERKVTIGSYEVDFDADFILIGTMNPEDNSTEPLSDVFLDRFDLLTMGYPETHAIEESIVLENGQHITSVPQDILSLIVHYVRTLRKDERLEKLPSVRATLGIYDRAQTNAYLNNKTAVTIEDVGAVLDSVIAHRIRLKPSIGLLMSAEKFVESTFEEAQKLLGDGR